MTKMVSYTLSARPIFWRLGRCIIYSGIVITATSKWVSTNPNNRPLALGILAVAALLGLALPLKGEVTETTRRGIAAPASVSIVAGVPRRYTA